MHSSKSVSLQDKNYFNYFFQHNYQTLCYFAFCILKDKHLAEDIVQNIFTRLLNTPESFNSEDHLKRFLYKSIKNECINELKKNTTRNEILEKMASSIIDENDSDISHLIVRAEVYSEIINAINNLPSKCGEIFKLAYIEHLDNDEIAKKLAISINTVKVQKNNAKKTLRENLKHLYPILAIILHL